MGSGIIVEIDEAEEIVEAIEAAAGGEIALGALAAELAEGVTVVITFGDGSSYTYEGVPVDDAARILADHGLYNSLLRGKTSVRSKKGGGTVSKFTKFL